MSSFHRLFRPVGAAGIAACALVGIHLWAAPLAGQEAGLRGVVVDPEGQPVAGAEVSAGSVRLANGRRRHVRAGATRTGRAPPCASIAWATGPSR